MDSGPGGAAAATASASASPLLRGRFGRVRPIRLHPRLSKRSRRGFRGFPAATVAWYGPDDTRATKAVVTFVSDGSDLREDPFTGDQVVAFVEKHDAVSVFVAGEVLGCPHEEGVDYPEGGSCPECPFWAGRDRWAATKERLGEARGELLSRAIEAAKEDEG